jgi:hypothetical protein
VAVTLCDKPASFGRFIYKFILMCSTIYHPFLVNSDYTRLSDLRISGLLPHTPLGVSNVFGMFLDKNLIGRGFRFKSLTSVVHEVQFWVGVPFWELEC